MMLIQELSAIVLGYSRRAGATLSIIITTGNGTLEPRTALLLRRRGTKYGKTWAQEYM